MRRKRLPAEAPAPAKLVVSLRPLARPLQGAEDLDPLLEHIGDARFTDMPMTAW
jgi:hypothetical protein